jgi:serine/threonine protein kinase
MVGILLFELLCGHAPFEGDSADEIYERIKAGIDHVHFQPGFPKYAAILVRQLCQRIPEIRLLAPQVRDHRWFKCSAFDWNMLKAQKMPAPYLPMVTSARDVSNFRGNDSGEDPPVRHFVDDGTGWDKEFDCND